MNIRYLILVLTTRCNLDCLYCYNGDDSKKIDMSGEVMERAFDLVKNGDSPLHIQLTGGEPSLVPGLVEKAVRMAEEKLRRPISIAIQTNASMLTEDFISFLKMFSVQVGISLDGPPAVHERIRGKVAATLNGIQLLEKMKVPFRVTTVVSSMNVSSLDRLVMMVSCFSQARGIGLDLLVRKGRASRNCRLPGMANHQTLSEGIERMMKTLMSVNKGRSSPLTLREFEMVKRQVELMSDNEIFCHACSEESLAVHP